VKKRRRGSRRGVREGACIGQNWGCYYATALDIEVDPQRCYFGSCQSYFALQAVVECRAARLNRSASELLAGFAMTFQPERQWFRPTQMLPTQIIINKFEKKNNKKNKQI